MGLDVNLYAAGEVTDAEIARADAYLRERFGEPDYDDTWLERPLYAPGRVELQTLRRYYGPNYERGDWPTIYAYILALREALPNCTIHYGSDAYDECPEATLGELARIWRHWLGPDGQAYRR